MDINTFKYDQRLDTAFLDSIYDGDMEHAAISFEQFLHKYPAQLKELDESFIAGNITIFRQKLHKLKPTFSYVGLTEITAKAEIIEKLCNETPHLNVISRQYVDLKQQLNDLIPVVEQEFKRLNT
jgi:HPt (histidine-containing phosphotransfer) domain-containing protein